MCHQPPKRRWFRFSLRTLFVVVALFGCWLGWNLYRVNERDRCLHEIAQRGARILSPAFFSRHYGSVRTTTQAGVPVVWKLMGADPLGAIVLPDNQFDDLDRRRIQSLFPEAAVTVEAYPLGSGQGIM